MKIDECFTELISCPEWYQELGIKRRTAYDYVRQFHNNELSYEKKRNILQKSGYKILVPEDWGRDLDNPQTVFSELAENPQLVSQKVSELMKYLNLSAVELAFSLGYKSPNIVYFILSGKENKKRILIFLNKLKKLNVNENWILYNKGAVLKVSGRDS